MKVQRLRDVREVLRSPKFEDWYSRYGALRQAIVDARERRDDLLAQSSMVSFRAERTQQTADEAVFEAGELENAAEESRSEYSRIENDSFETLSAFEMQRQRASDVWATLGGMEAQLEEVRQKAMELRAQAEAAHKGGTPEGAAEAERIEHRLRDLEAEMASRMRDIEATRRREADEEAARERLWHDVEASWTASFEANMARTEYEYRARRQRNEIERLFGKAAAERQRVGELGDEAKRTAERIGQLEREFSSLIAEARREFDCTLNYEFLYWTRQDDVRLAYVVPLIDESEHLNIQVTALRVYEIERSKGLDFLAPVPEEPGEGGLEDPRLESFFFEGRPSPTVASSGGGE